jgi:hypothetical protein
MLLPPGAPRERLSLTFSSVFFQWLDARAQFRGALPPAFPTSAPRFPAMQRGREASSQIPDAVQSFNLALFALADRNFKRLFSVSVGATVLPALPRRQSHGAR